MGSMFILLGVRSSLSDFILGLYHKFIMRVSSLFMLVPSEVTKVPRENVLELDLEEEAGMRLQE